MSGKDGNLWPRHKRRPSEGQPVQSGKARPKSTEAKVDLWVGGSAGLEPRLGAADRWRELWHEFGAAVVLFAGGTTLSWLFVFYLVSADRNYQQRESCQDNSMLLVWPLTRDQFFCFFDTVTILSTTRPVTFRKWRVTRCPHFQIICTNKSMRIESQPTQLILSRPGGDCFQIGGQLSFGLSCTCFLSKRQQKRGNKGLRLQIAGWPTDFR